MRQPNGEADSTLHFLNFEKKSLIIQLQLQVIIYTCSFEGKQIRRRPSGKLRAGKT